MATAVRRLLTADEFLAIEFPSDTKAELDNGVIKMMSGGTGSHARVQRNVQFALQSKLRETGCSAWGPDMAVRTHQLSIRYPDVSVFCGRDGIENDKLKAFDDPKLVVEVLSPSTRNEDETEKLHEYCVIPSLEVIVHIDPDKQTVRLLTRTDSGGWSDRMIENEADVRFEALGIDLTWPEIFAR